MTWRQLLSVLLLAALAACNDMDTQKRGKPYSASALFPDGKLPQAPPEGTLAQDDPALAEALAHRPPMSLELLQRGHRRYEIFCTPCHDYAGTGHGTVVARGFPRPENFHTDRLRKASSRDIVDVISHGRGTMYDFADRVPPADRWAIAAYIRALQLSQNASLAELPPQDRTAVEAIHD